MSEPSSLLSSPDPALPSGGVDQPPVPEVSDEAWVRRIIEAGRRGDRPGSQRGIEELFHRHGGRIFNLLARVLCDREEAADLAQEVFVRVQSRLDTFDPENRFRAWITAIAWNLARDQLRRRMRRGTPVSLDAQRGDSGGERGPEWVDPRSPSPTRACELRERDALVRCALARVSPTQRAMLVLREYEGLSYEEIARICDVRPGTVKSRLNRARLEFRDRLRDLSPEMFS